MKTRKKNLALNILDKKFIKVDEVENMGVSRSTLQ